MCNLNSNDLLNITFGRVIADVFLSSKFLTNFSECTKKTMEMY